MMLSKFTILRSGQWPAGSREIILTFDDGPNPVNRVSENLLDVLSAQDVKATLCYIGENIEKASDTVGRAHREGHQIAIHTYSHTIRTLISVNGLNREIKETTKCIRSATGDKKYYPLLFRPPLGIMTSAVNRSVEENNMKVAYLSFFVNDAFAGKGNWKSKIEKIKKRLLKHQGGAVVLHEMRYQNSGENAIDKSWLPQAVDELIKWANHEGFTFTLYDGKKANPKKPFARTVNSCAEFDVSRRGLK